MVLLTEKEALAIIWHVHGSTCIFTDIRVLIPHEMRDKMFRLAPDGRVGKVVKTSRLRSTLW
jgi:hypothetical protein